MQCHWPTCRTAIVCLLGMAALTVTVGVNGAPSSKVSDSLPPLAAGEQNLRRTPAHRSEFTPIYASVSSTCADTRLPEALLTPDPVMQDLGSDRLIQVSFIVGADGRVHSAFILDSGGRNQDRAILGAVGRWRYRPALCNGVPTPMEARVSFVLR